MSVYSLIALGVWAGVRGGLLVITPMQALHFSAAFMVGTFLLSPDLDLSQGRVNSKNNWGLLGALWVPYGMIFSHRGTSHSWVVGPLTRLVYLGCIVVLGLGLFTALWPHVPLPQLPRPLTLKFVLPTLLGYYVSQWLHLIADGIRPDHGLRHTHRTYHKVRQEVTQAGRKKRRKRPKAPAPQRNS